jgi:hypothetical protein
MEAGEDLGLALDAAARLVESRAEPCKGTRLRATSRPSPSTASSTTPIAPRPRRRTTVQGTQQRYRS